MKPLKNPQLYIAAGASQMYTTENMSAEILYEGELFVKLGKHKFTGCIQILTSHGIREIYALENQHVVLASSTKQ